MPAVNQSRCKANVPRPGQEWMEIPVPPVVCNDVFEAAHQRRQANKLLKGAPA